MTGVTWFKSSYSGSQGGNCIEVATDATAVHIRDSKDTHGPVLTVRPAAWAAFTQVAKGDAATGPR